MCSAGPSGCAAPAPTLRTWRNSSLAGIAPPAGWTSWSQATANVPSDFWSAHGNHSWPGAALITCRPVQVTPPFVERDLYTFVFELGPASQGSYSGGSPGALKKHSSVALGLGVP